MPTGRHVPGRTPKLQQIGNSQWIVPTTKRCRKNSDAEIWTTSGYASLNMPVEEAKETFVGLCRGFMDRKLENAG